MNTTFRRKTKDERRKNLVKESCRRFLSSLVWILSFVLLVACDFHGPWEYYPEEREVYTGIYTYGYVMARENPYVCFSKVYQLDEASSSLMKRHRKILRFTIAQVSLLLVALCPVKILKESIRLRFSNRNHQGRTVFIHLIYFMAFMANRMS